jgi:hypothetical protein
VDSKGRNIFYKPEAIIRMIKIATPYYEASRIARACARGASLGVITVGEAYNVCLAELDRYNPD